MSELEKTFNPKESESKWYQVWEEGGHFKPKDGKTGKSHTIIMPPPNVTGILHIGHALDATTQDVLTRYKRMKGFKALWLPGMDHAGIATQSKVEQMIWDEEKKTRHDYSREDFLEKIWKWKVEYGGTILKQQRMLGASCDWDYSMFTMDPEAHEAVNEVFVTLFNEGLIYQSDYIVNWDPKIQSAISDAEVRHIEVKGAFYHLIYNVKDSDEKLEIATTRPETLLGDTAVCVHPDDDRYKHLIGRKAIVPICNREVTIIADEHVDMELGTGCLKVTPGHDFNDFEIGQRHNLEIITILNKDGTLNEHGGKYQGKKCLDMRKDFVKELEDLGVLKEIKEHIHQVGHAEKYDVVIEPLVSKQWFLNVQEMAKVAVEAVEKEEVKFFPKGWENTYFSWLREPKNWCISRQLWWGHQIPVFYCHDCNHKFANTGSPQECQKCNSQNIHQDPDVLDTWFSSALWPFSTLGWPNKERMNDKEFEDFFPTTTLVTGFDIIFFWVARMMMMSYKFTGKKPFENIYIHAIVRDKLGRKMSKSLGNGIDPLDMVEKYGADALRFSLAINSGYNRNINLDPERIEGYRNFINKIWNAFRFIHPFLENASENFEVSDRLEIEEKWIISKLNDLTKTMSESLDIFRYDDACNALYQFIYNDFCGYFIELSKPVLYSENKNEIENRSNLLLFCFKKIMKLLHPVSPFITEEIWSLIKNEQEGLIISEDYPEFQENHSFENEQKQMEKFIEVITNVRNLRASVNVKPKDEVSIILQANEINELSFFENSIEKLGQLARIKKIEIIDLSKERPAKSISATTGFCQIHLPLEGAIDINEQIARLTKQLEKTEKEFLKVDKKVNNQKFMDNAPDEVVAEVKEKHQELSTKINGIKETIESFK